MRISPPYSVPGAEPSLLRAGKTACLLLHGFTAQPEEMKFLAGDLHGRGYTVLIPRLAGHGTQPRDLGRVHWSDWLLSVEDGLDLLSGVAEQVVLIGQSMGAVIALTAAAEYPVAAVVGLSTPNFVYSGAQVLLARALGAFGLMAGKHSPEHPELGARRQADYPAYARYPVRIIPELARLQLAMRAALPAVSAPVLLVDVGIGTTSLDEIHARLGASIKEKLWLDELDHSLVRDEKRQIVFDAIAAFLHKLHL